VEEIITARVEAKRDVAAEAVIGNTGQVDELDDLLKALSISPLHNAGNSSAPKAELGE
jgi:hypothetical protein